MPGSPADSFLRPPADFSLDEDGCARAPETGDVYFSAEDGLAESRAVFLQGCGLPQRWTDRAEFTIAELGFGTGLNIAALLELWRRTRPAGARLHIVTVEGRPLSRVQAEAAFARWPELSDVAARLLANWPPRWSGAHRRRFDELGVTLTILHEDAEAALAQADFRADAWFLDGFAPARNPQMWSEAVMREMARLSAPGAVAATFTVAGAVRRGLEAVGFRVEKKPGFGRKRERLEAVYTGIPAIETPTPFPRLAPQAGRVAVIGGGIAGASLAHALRARGRDVVLIAEGGLAAGASGAPSGLLTPRLEAADRPHVRATLAAFAYARTLYDGLDGFHPEGVLRIADDAGKSARLDQLSNMLGEGFERVGADEAERLTGVAGAPGGLFMTAAGRFEPARLVAALAGDARVLAARVSRLSREAGSWRLRDGGGAPIAEAEIVVLAGGAAMAALARDAGLALEPGAGRVILTRPSSRAPRAGVAWGGYVSAGPDGTLLVGATHVRGEDPGSAEPADAQLRAGLAGMLPGAAPGATVSGWTGVRAALADRLPAAGAAAGTDFQTVWANVARGGPAPVRLDGWEAVQPGLAVLGGLGARGFAHAPLLAEMIAADLDGEPAVLERSGRDALHPARFLFRALRRG